MYNAPTISSNSNRSPLLLNQMSLNPPQRRLIDVILMLNVLCFKVLVATDLFKDILTANNNDCIYNTIPESLLSLEMPCFDTLSMHCI